MHQQVVGLCQCGCGQPAPLAPVNRPGRGLIKGRPQRFIRGHRARLPRGKDKSPRKRRWDRGEQSTRWKGGVRVRPTGYVDVIGAGGGRGRHRAAHIVVVERAIGRRLPPHAVVHHIDGDRQNNSNTNLVALQSQRDHVELHRKLRVLRAGGNAWTDRMCCFCRLPKPSSQFYLCRNRVRGKRYSGACIECARKDARDRQRARAAGGAA